MTISEPMLMAYADGELSASDSAEVEAARVDRYRAQRARLQAAFGPTLDEPVPARLLAAARVVPVIGPRRRWTGTEFAAMAAGPVRVTLSFRDQSGAYCRTFALRDSGGTAGLACRAGGTWQVRLVNREGTTPDAGPYRQAASALSAEVRRAVDASIAGIRWMQAKKPLRARLARLSRAAGISAPWSERSFVALDVQRPHRWHWKSSALTGLQLSPHLPVCRQ